MKTCGRVDVVGGERSASHPGSFTPGDKFVTVASSIMLLFAVTNFGRWMFMYGLP
jgi:hypothetical protein